MGLTPAEMLDYLKGRGCRIGGVTMGERGLLWYDETGTVRSTAALAVPADKIVDTSGAGDVFHGAYVYAYLADPAGSWDSHFRLPGPPRRTKSSTWETRPASLEYRASTPIGDPADFAAGSARGAQPRRDAWRANSAPRSGNGGAASFGLKA